MSSLRKVFVCLMVLVSSVALSATLGYAYTVSHCVSVPLASTNWNTTISIPKFTGDCECLQSVCFQLCGHVEGTAKFESMDASATTVAMNLQSTITLSRPDLSPLVVVIPLANTSDNVTAFDGTIDFGGTSGRTYGGLSGDDIDSMCSTAPADFALFCGTGNIDLPIGALGTSYGSGAGNLILQFSTSASANATVTYTYDCGTPVEGSTWGRIKGLF